MRQLLIATLVLGAGAFAASCTTNTKSPSPSATTPAAPVSPVAPPRSAAPSAPAPATPGPAPAPAAPPPGSVSGLPAGPGAELVAAQCQGCHDLDTVTSEHHDLAGWHSVITDMIGNGATITDADADQIAIYLAANFK